MGDVVVVVGAAGSLGASVVERARRDPAVTLVVAHDAGAASEPAVAAIGSGGSAPPAAPGAEVRWVDADGLDELAPTADVVVVLGRSTPGDAGLTGTGVAADADVLHRLLARCAGDGPTVVLLSSALVYGASPANPVPLTEAAPLRPPAGLPELAELAEQERIVSEWRRDAPGRRVVVLRPVVTVDRDQAGWFRRSPWSATPVVAGGVEPPAQLLHRDDLVAAIDLARRHGEAGVLNVAPPGWMPADDLRDLMGPGRRLRLPHPLAERTAALRRRVGAPAPPPALLAYTQHPWVVASDRLTALGWRPAHTNEEVLVEVAPGGAATGGAARRQAVTLAAAAALAAGVAVGVVLAVRRVRRR